MAGRVDPVTATLVHVDSWTPEQLPALFTGIKYGAAAAVTVCSCSTGPRSQLGVFVAPARNCLLVGWQLS